jgi:hypothetical protein
MQYERETIERVVRPVLPLVQQCFDQHPLPGALPGLVSVTMNLWSMGPNTGFVSSVRVAEEPALSQCLAGVFTPLSFGPPKDPKLPAGSVAVVVVVEAR